MVNSLLPIGDYLYNKDEYSFDESWEKLERAFKEKEFVVCYAVSQSEDGKYIELEYHNIRGKIFRGYLTQNRGLHSEYFIKKSFCVGILKLNTREKIFEATHIPVELEARKQLSSLQIGEKISGKISFIGGGGAFAFVDVKEGLIFFISAKNIFWRPVGCQKFDAYYSIGDSIVGIITGLERKDKPQHPTIGTLTCLNFNENWELETKDISVGKTIKGIPMSEILHKNMYFFPYSQHVYIEFYSESSFSDNEEVEISVTEIDSEKHLVKANLVLNDEEQQISNNTEDDNKVIDNMDDNKKKEKTGSLFDLDIKATVSPFCVRLEDKKEFESTPNEITNFYTIQKRIKDGQLNNQHFMILRAINLFVFCTSKQIVAWLYCNGEIPEGFNQNKLNIRLDTMSKLGLVDKIRFKSGVDKSIYRVYFLNKNGDRLLSGFLGTKRTSYQEALLVTPSWEIKKYLATNQIVLAFKENFEFLQSFFIRRILSIDNDNLIRPSAIIVFPNSTFLLETRRRYPGWKENLVEKMKRYSCLLENYQKGALLPNSKFLLNKRQLYFLIICEDIENALEIRDLLWGHTLYPFIFFTYDLLVFQKDINYSIFRFEGVERKPTYYNITELSCYNLYYTEREQNNESEKKKDEITDFKKCFKRGYFLGLEYLQKHDNPLLKKMVDEDLHDIYRIDEKGNYCAVYSEEEQYYIYILYLINHNFLQSLIAEFHEKKPYIILESAKEFKETETISKLEYSTPAKLEIAVELVLQRIYKWCIENMNNFNCIDAPFQITKLPLRQTNGVQFGYDVGMNFKYYGEIYHIGFECKNYDILRKKMNAGTNARLTVDAYAYNLLEFFMYAEEDVHNIWILISPFGNLQNNFDEKLFEKWNRTSPFMKIRSICSSQTSITCEEFLSLDEKAYHSIYQHDPPQMTLEEQNQLLERVFYTIIEPEELKESFESILSKYPFNVSLSNNEQMVIRTLQGDNVSEQILDKLAKNQNVFLIGEYGSGKTMMTQFIVRTILEHQELYPFFPLWFKLSACLGELTYENIEFKAKTFVENGKKQYDNFPKDLTMNGRLRILIILDGLDEIVSGLGESDLKFLLLEHICIKLNSTYGYNPLFIITSRDIDFKSCMNSQHEIPFFCRFYQIIIGNCKKEDAIQKLQDVEKQNGWNQEEMGPSVTQNNKLMSIAQKPLYFGFVREFIIDHVFWEDYVDELDVLKAIVEKSVKHYTENNRVLNEKSVIQHLYDWAREISIQMTTGGSSEILVYKWNFPFEETNNVICLREVHDNKYGLQFYHNAIREFLVAEELYQDIVNCITGNDRLISRIEERLKQIELTPEMLDFFSKLVDKNAQTKDYVTKQIVKILRSANSIDKQRLGTNLFSILYHLHNELTNLDLNGIYTNNLYIWNCSLKNINLQNAYMTNLRLFNVYMENIDFRRSDLTGLIMGQEDKILDVQHRQWMNGFSIFVLYENQQLAEFRFSETESWEDYDIIHHANIKNHEYCGFCPLENNILYYSEKEVFFESNPEKSYIMSDNKQLLQVTPSYFLVEQNQCMELIIHSFKYQETNILPLMPNQKNMLCVLDQKGYLYIDEESLFLQQNGKSYFITHINSEFECFTAIRSSESYYIKVYIKYSNNIQVIQYSFEQNEKQYTVFKLPQFVSFEHMKAVKVDVLYGVFGKTVYLFDLSARDIQLYDLHINVKCKDLILENPDTTDRIHREDEYELLKKINDYSE